MFETVTGMDLARYRGLFAGVGAGLGLGVAIYLLERFRSHRRLFKDIAFLKEAVSDLQRELSTLRSNDRVDGSGDRIRRRRRRQVSGYDSESTVDMYSAFETDDDEFFDLSSDGEDLMQVSLRQNQENQESEETQALFAKVDELMKGSEADQQAAMELLLSNVGSHGENINFLWRVAKAYRLEAAATDDKDRKKQSVERGITYATKALHKNKAHGDANKWFAILIGMRNDYLPTKEKIENAVVFQKHLEIALTAKPDDYSLYHLLSRFKFEIANMSWLERKLAATLFGSLPQVTLDDAIADGLKCEELCPESFPDNQVLLARCYISNSDYSSGISWLDKAVSHMTETPQVRAQINFNYRPPGKLFIQALRYFCE